MRGSRGSYSSRGGVTRGNYGSSYSSRGSNNDRTRYNSYSSGGGTNDRQYGGGGQYGNRNRDNSASGGSGRYHSAPYKRPHDSMKDRSDDRKKPRQDDYRRPLNTSGRNERQSGQFMGSSSSTTGYRGSSGHSSSYQARDSVLNRHHRTSPPMGPPKRGPIRGVSGGYGIRPRGAGSSTIGSRPMRISSRGGASFMRTTRVDKDDNEMRNLRKKLLYAERKDRARVMRIQQLTSSLRRRNTGREKRGNDDLSDHSADDDATKKTKSAKDKADESEDDWGLSPSPVKKRKSSDGAENDDGASEKAIDKEDINNSNNVAAEIVERVNVKEDADNDTENWDNSFEDKEDDNKKSKEKTVEKSGKKKDRDEISVDKDKEVSNKSEKDEKRREKEDDKRTSVNKESPIRSKDRDRNRNFIKLNCIHCHVKCITFKEYSHHLNSRTHSNGLRRVAQRQRSELVRLRVRQRTAQRTIEEGISEEVESKFCRICRLAYRQTKAEHQASEHHRTIKKFLMPYCSTCHQAFKSPMVYEVHRCSIDHIRNKVRNEDSESDESADEREIDLNKFFTVDSVGEIEDGTLEAEIDALLAEIDSPKDENDADADQKLPGSECVKKIESFYCELCNHYSPKVGDDSLQAYILKHCKQRSHLRAFINNNAEKGVEKLDNSTEDAADKGEDDLNEEIDNEEGVDEDIEEGVELDKSEETANGTHDNEDMETNSINEDTTEADDSTQVDEETVNNSGNVEKACEEDVEMALGALLADVPQQGDDDDDEDEEDESVLNIDIESEKSKIKQKEDKDINGKVDIPVKQEGGKGQTAKSILKTSSTPLKAKATSSPALAKKVVTLPLKANTAAAAVLNFSKSKSATLKATPKSGATKATVKQATTAKTNAATPVTAKGSVSPIATTTPPSKSRPQRKVPVVKKSTAAGNKSLSQK